LHKDTVRGELVEPGVFVQKLIIVQSRFMYVGEGLLLVYKFARALAVAVVSGLLLAVLLFVLGIAATDYLVGPNLGNALEKLEGEAWYSGQAALHSYHEFHLDIPLYSER
jgi:hypothetical protein